MPTRRQRRLARWLCLAASADLGWSLSAPVAANQNTLPAPVATGVRQNKPGEREIVVSAVKPRGTVSSDLPAELTLKTLDVRAFGANDVQDLLQSLGARAGYDASGGEPIVLLNGKRVSSYAEIAKIPAEAIERVEVFPAELAIRYGYAASRKVVNVVVFERFNSRLGILSVAAPSEGGRSTPGGVFNYLRIRGDARLNVDVDYSRSDALLESERGVVQPAGLTNQAAFRTLLPSNERLALSGTISGNLISEVSSSLNATFESSTGRSLLGLGPAGAIQGRSRTQTAHVGTSWGGSLAKWQWTLTANYDLNVITTAIGTSMDLAAVNEARATTRVINGELLLAGPLVNLPAGPVSAAISGGVEFLVLNSRSMFAGAVRSADLGRDRTSLQLNLDLPITNRQKSVAPRLGDMSLNLNARILDLSDVGRLTGHGLGLTWSPARSLSIVASHAYEEVAPTVQQLGAPVLVTPNVRLFDFARQETIDVTRVTGGTRSLRPETRQAYNFGLTAKPFDAIDLVLTLDYRSLRSRSPVAEFPIITPAIELAFAERFTRDATGRLFRLDATPVNFARSRQEDIHLGLSFSHPLGAVPAALQGTRIRVAATEADVQRAVRPGTRLSRVEAGSAAARQVDNLMSRLYLGLSYRRRLVDELDLGELGPRLDLLDGGAIGLRGGNPRDELEFQAGVFKRGLGARVSVSWQGPTSIVTADSRLAFEAFGTVNLSAFVNVADQLGGPAAPTWAKGLRVNLNVINVLNNRPRVRDGSGFTPINYQAAYLNPLGRLISLTVRKSI